MPRASTVLIVDDDEEFRSALGEMLEGEHCKVLSAQNGRQALKILETIRPDLIVADLMMPVMSGWELSAELEKSELLRDIPVVILSGVARFRPLGRSRVLAKPFRLSTLVALLDMVDAP
jgi:CheY-like chemotaxis protein